MKKSLDCVHRFSWGLFHSESTSSSGGSEGVGMAMGRAQGVGASVCSEERPSIAFAPLNRDRDDSDRGITVYNLPGIPLPLVWCLRGSGAAGTGGCSYGGQENASLRGKLACLCGTLGPSWASLSLRGVKYGVDLYCACAHSSSAIWAFVTAYS